MGFNIQDGWRHIVASTRAKAPEILTGIGIGGMITTTVLAVKQTPEAMRHIEAKKVQVKRRKLTAKETVEAAWKCYIWPAVTGIVSTGCLIGSCAINNRRKAALAAIASIAETSLREYRDQTRMLVGSKKEERIFDQVDKEYVERNPPKRADEEPEKTVDGRDKTLCLDATFGTEFYSDIETIRQTVNDLNFRMNNMSEPYISVNEFYEELGADRIDIGDELGWRSDRALIEVRFSSQIVKGRPALVMRHVNLPKADFNKV